MADVDVRVATARAYDLIVDEYVRRTNDIDDALTEFRAAFVAAVGPEATVGDVGCGPGRDATYFRSLGIRTVGLDASFGMASRAQEAGVAAIRADMRRLPVRARRLDGIWSVASLLHVPRPDVPATLATWRACLRPGGVLGLGTSAGTGEGWEACPYDPTSQHAATGLRRWFVHHDESELGDLVERAGFEIAQSRVRQGNRRWLQLIARRSAAPDPSRGEGAA